MKLAALVFDWAGTMVDYGSRAPTEAFIKVFEEFGVSISAPDARGPMGLPKRDHIKALLDNHTVRSRWTKAHSAPPTDADVDKIYEIFVPLNADIVTDFSDLIPGVLETIAVARARGLKIGSTTGYTREIMERLVPAARVQGLVVDNLVCAGDLALGRPTPHMMYRCFLDLGIWPASSVIKVDDTEVGIAEGLSAGSWTIGVALSGNACGLSRTEVEALTDSERCVYRRQAEGQLRRAGAHYVVDSAADLPPVLDEIEGRLLRGEHP